MLRGTLPMKHEELEPMQNKLDADCCTARRYEITRSDLPLCCPTESMRLWDAHPRVYLPIETLGEVTCPYCDATYVLNNEK
jgi:uncharacterized Zn-finger protein